MNKFIHIMILWQKVLISIQWLFVATTSTFFAGKTKKSIHRNDYSAFGLYNNYHKMYKYLWTGRTNISTIQLITKKAKVL